MIDQPGNVRPSIAIHRCSQSSRAVVWHYWKDTLSGLEKRCSPVFRDLSDRVFVLLQGFLGKYLMVRTTSGNQEKDMQYLENSAEEGSVRDHIRARTE